jgi:hypothetical protein
VNPLAVGDLDLRQQEDPLAFDLQMHRDPDSSLLRVEVFGKDLAKLDGYQFALGFHPEQLVLEDIQSTQLSDDHFGVFPEAGLVRHNWYRQERELNPKLPLFTLYFRARTQIVAQDILSLRDRQLSAEAYLLDGSRRRLTLAYRGQDLSASTFRLSQNFPNPFRDETRISIFLPERENGRFQVIDQQGRVVWEVAQTFAAGWQILRLRREELPVGVLWYRYTGKEYTATRKMLILDE